MHVDIKFTFMIIKRIWQQRKSQFGKIKSCKKNKSFSMHFQVITVCPCVDIHIVVYVSG